MHSHHLAIIDHILDNVTASPLIPKTLTHSPFEMGFWQRMNGLL